MTSVTIRIITSTSVSDDTSLSYSALRQCMLFLLCMSTAFTGSAQTIIGMEIRPRAEFRHGFKDLIADNEKAAFFIEQRSRLNLSYQDDKLITSIRVQDVRTWGETAQINKSDHLFSLHEAWAQYAFTKRLSAKAGRQELVYDDHRMLGNLDWAAQGRSHDALKIMYVDSLWTIHAAGAYNQSSVIPEPSRLTNNFYTTPGGFTQAGGGLPNYKYMQMLWGEVKIGKFYSSFLLLNTGWQMPDTTINNLATAGINPSFAFTDKIKITGTWYHQFGYDRSGQKVQADLLSLAVNLAAAKSTHAIGFDYLSGTTGNTKTSHTFDPLFGTHHRFYGLMDYFYVGNPHAQQGNTIGLEDFFVRSTFKWNTRTTLLTEVHQFRSPVKIIDPENTGNWLPGSLGTEIDLTLQHSFYKYFTGYLGYSNMFGTQSLEAIKGGSHKNYTAWAWVMLSFKPELFNSSASR